MTTAKNGQWEVLDYTPLVALVERTDNALEALGLFEPFFGTTTTVEVERVTLGSDAIEAKLRGGERNYAGKETSQVENFRIPFFPLDSLAKASDVQDFREYGTADTPATVDSRVTRNITRIRSSHDFLRRKAMYTCLKGSTYAPGLAGSQFIKSFATTWGVTGLTGSIDFTVATSDPALYVEVNAREPIIAAAANNAATLTIVCLCGSGFFNSMVNHPLVQAAYDQYASQQSPLRERLGGDIIGKVFEHKGVTYIEDISGEIARGDAYVLPTGIADLFQVHYAPADTIEHANTIASDIYVFLEETRRSAEIQTETSFVCIGTRPELISALTGNTLLADA